MKNQSNNPLSKTINHKPLQFKKAKNFLRIKPVQILQKTPANNKTRITNKSSKKPIPAPTFTKIPQKPNDQKLQLYHLKNHLSKNKKTSKKPHFSQHLQTKKNYSKKPQFKKAKKI